MLRIIAPANHAVFDAPVDIPIFVYGQTLGVGYEFTNVQIFAGTNSLGFTHRLNRLLLPPVYGISPIAIPEDIAQFDLPEYSLVWTNPAPGTYVLTAVGQRPYPGVHAPPRAQSSLSPPLP